MPFIMNSPAFEDGSAIPTNYTCDGENISPPLEWSGAPAETRSFVLILEDPDAPSGMFRHWAVYNIAGGRTLLPEGVGAGVKTESLGYGINDFGDPHYGGPCPPKGHGTHHYHFRLAALKVETLTVPNAPKVTDVWDAAQPHIIDQAELVGTYSR
ncbi:YbhB/YbcL family Raf kinase inhibitor-like protein [Rhodospirillaceae bacterium SYSU D60014]|uniref:YbhB/YbcL family Raf kinase inhibitor-like protein n=1 Tax=Virgifigura deserti TaxID=2268457 RepID=UPI000E6616C4